MARKALRNDKSKSICHRNKKRSPTTDRTSFFYSAAVSGTGEITRIASRDKREIFRETRPLGSTPLEAARSSREDTSFKAAFTVSTSLLAMAELNFLTAVLTAELTERFLRRLFSDCRALLRADG